MRKTRSDCRVGTFEKKNGLPPGTAKNTVPHYFPGAMIGHKK